MMKEMIELNPPENKRTYYFRDLTVVNLFNVTHFLDSKSTHRLKTKDGKLHIIPKDFNHIEIKCEEFTL